MPEHVIERLGKGLHKQPDDPRDLHAAFVLGAVPIDWSKPFQLTEPPNEDQGGSLSCVAQSSSYFHWQIHRLDWSRRDLYSRIFLPQGGAYLRDGVAQIASKGQATRSDAPDPKPETEANMRVRTGITADMERIGLEASYFTVNAKSPDAVAQAIRDTGGCIIGIQGDNAGWHDLANPKPPVNFEWGHALYCFGFHMHDGVKCIIAKSSWGTNGNTTVHHVKQNYFDSGNTFDGWTLIPKEQLPMYNRYRVFHQATGRQGVLVVGQTGFSDSIVWAKNQAMLNQLMADFEVPTDAPVITLS